MTPIRLGEAPASRARAEHWEPAEDFEGLREHRQAFRAMLLRSIENGRSQAVARRSAIDTKAAAARAAAEASRVAQARAVAQRQAAEERAREQMFAEFRRELEIIDKAKAVGLSGERALALARRHATDEEIIAETVEARVLSAVERMVGGRP